MIGRIIAGPESKIKNWAGIETPSTSLYYAKRFYIGTGNTPAKQSDYKMESLIDDAVYLSKLEIVCASGNGSYESETGLFVSGTVTNMSSSPLEVSEIGFSASSTGANIEDVLYLLAREALDTPIIIASGETKSFVLKLF